MSWEEYIEDYGDPTTEVWLTLFQSDVVIQAVWHCKLCGEMMKHERNSVKHHISQKHDLTWAEYKERTKHSQHQGGYYDVKEEVTDIVSFVKEEVLDGVTLKETDGILKELDV